MLAKSPYELTTVRWRRHLREILFPWTKTDRGSTSILSLGAYELFLLLIYLANMVVLAMNDTADVKATTERSRIFKILEVVFTCIYIVEIGISITAFGLKAFANGARILDCALILANLFVLIAFYADEESRGTTNFSLLSLRCSLRILRPFFATTQFPSIRLFVVSVAKSILQLTDVLLVYILFLLWFGVAGVYQFGGALRPRCVNDIYFASQLPLFVGSSSTTTPPVGWLNDRTDLVGDYASQLAPVAVLFTGETLRNTFPPDSATKYFPPILYPNNSLSDGGGGGGDLDDYTLSLVAAAAVMTFSESYVSANHLTAESFICGSVVQSALYDNVKAALGLGEEVRPNPSRWWRHNENGKTSHNETISLTASPSLTVPKDIWWYGAENGTVTPEQLFYIVNSIFPLEPRISCSALQTCSLSDIKAVGTSYQCPFGYRCVATSQNPHRNFVGFDNLGQALLSLYTGVTFQLWYELMYWMRDSTNEASIAYFLLLIIIGAFMIINLTVVVLTVEYEKAKANENRRLKAQSDIPEASGANNSRRSGLLAVVQDALRNRQQLLEQGFTSDQQQQQQEEDERKNKRRRSQSIAKSDAAAAAAAAAAAVAANTLEANEVEPSTPDGLAVVVTNENEEEAAPRWPEPSSNNDNNEVQGGEEDEEDEGGEFRRRMEEAKKETRQALKEAGDSSKWRRTWILSRYWVRWYIVERRWFELLTNLLILANMILLCYNHYDMDEATEQLFERLNLFFTCYFTFEVLFRAWPLPIMEYLSNRFNIFDVCIVIVSWVDLGVDSVSFPVARAFRILRVAKLLKSFPSLYNWIGFIVAATKASPMLVFMLFLMMFTFSTFGMQILGGRMCGVANDQIPATWATYVEKVPIEVPATYENTSSLSELSTTTYTRYRTMEHIITRPSGFNEGVHCEGLPRSNFDSFGQAMLTSFQILTADDWNFVMYDSMSALNQAVAIPFVVFFYIGNYILLNLFIAILLSANKNDDEHLEEVLEEERKNEAARRRENELVRLEEQKEEERRRLMYTEAHDSSDDDVLDEELSERGGAGGNQQTRQQRDYVILRGGRLKKKSAASKAIDRFFRLWDDSKKYAKKLVEMTAWEFFMALVILVGSVCMGMEDPKAAPDTKLIRTLALIDLIVTIVYVLEFLVNWHAYGLVRRRTAYLRRDLWNVLDFFLVVISVIGVIVADLRSNQFVRTIKVLRALRPLRLVKKSPGMKLVLSAALGSLPQMRNVFLITSTIFTIWGVSGVFLFGGKLRDCFIGARPQLELTMAECERVGGTYINAGRQHFDNIFAAVLTLFQVSTLEGWVDEMYRAMDITNVGEPRRRDANTWAALYFMFIAAFAGLFLMNLFVAALIDAYNHEKRKVSFQRSILVTREQEAWLLTNKRIARFLPLEAKGKALMYQGPVSSARAESDELGDEWDFVGGSQTNLTDEDIEKMLGSTQHNASFQRQSFVGAVMDQTANARNKLRDAVRSTWFTNVFLFIIFLNFLAMAIEHYPQDKELETTTRILNYVFVAIFAFEVVIKVVGEGWRVFISSKWNRLDLFVAIIGVLSVALAPFYDPRSTALIRSLRIIRLARLTRGYFAIDHMIGQFGRAILSMIHVFAVIFLVFFIFSVTGMKLFGRVKRELFGDTKGIDRHTNFEDLTSALLALCRITTGGDWVSIMQSCAVEGAFCDANIDECGPPSPVTQLYFVVFLLISMFILKNLLTAVLLDSFSTNGDNRAISKSDATYFYRAWKHLDPKESLTLNPFDVLPLVRSLPKSCVLGFNNKSKRRRFGLEWSFLAALKLTSLKHRVTIAAVIDTLCKFSYEVPPPDKFSFVFEQFGTDYLESPMEALARLGANMKLLGFSMAGQLQAAGRLTVSNLKKVGETMTSVVSDEKQQAKQQRKKSSSSPAGGGPTTGNSDNAAALNNNNHHSGGGSRIQSPTSEASAPAVGSRGKLRQLHLQQNPASPITVVGDPISQKASPRTEQQLATLPSSPTHDSFPAAISNNKEEDGNVVVEEGGLARKDSEEVGRGGGGGGNVGSPVRIHTVNGTSLFVTDDGPLTAEEMYKRCASLIVINAGVKRWRDSRRRRKKHLSTSVASVTTSGGAAGGVDGGGGNRLSNKSFGGSLNSKHRPSMDAGGSSHSDGSSSEDEFGSELGDGEEMDELTAMRRKADRKAKMMESRRKRSFSLFGSFVDTLRGSSSGGTKNGKKGGRGGRGGVEEEEEMVVAPTVPRDENDGSHYEPVRLEDTATVRTSAAGLGSVFATSPPPPHATLMSGGPTVSGYPSSIATTAGLSSARGGGGLPPPSNARHGTTARTLETLPPLPLLQQQQEREEGGRGGAGFYGRPADNGPPATAHPIPPPRPVEEELVDLSMTLRRKKGDQQKQQGERRRRTANAAEEVVDVKKLGNNSSITQQRNLSSPLLMMEERAAASTTTFSPLSGAGNTKDVIDHDDGRNGRSDNVPVLSSYSPPPLVLPSGSSLIFGASGHSSASSTTAHNTPSSPPPPLLLRANSSTVFGHYQSNDSTDNPAAAFMMSRDRHGGTGLTTPMRTPLSRKRDGDGGLAVLTSPLYSPSASAAAGRKKGYTREEQLALIGGEQQQSPKATATLNPEHHHNTTIGDHQEEKKKQPAVKNINFLSMDELLPLPTTNTTTSSSTTASSSQQQLLSPYHTQQYRKRGDDNDEEGEEGHHHPEDGLLDVTFSSIQKQCQAQLFPFTCSGAAVTDNAVVSMKKEDSSSSSSRSNRLPREEATSPSMGGTDRHEDNHNVEEDEEEGSEESERKQREGLVSVLEKTFIIMKKNTSSAASVGTTTTAAAGGGKKMLPLASLRTFLRSSGRSSGAGGGGASSSGSSSLRIEVRDEGGSQEEDEDDDDLREEEETTSAGEIRRRRGRKLRNKKFVIVTLNTVLKHVLRLRMAMVQVAEACDDLTDQVVAAAALEKRGGGEAGSTPTPTTTTAPTRTTPHQPMMVSSSPLVNIKPSERTLVRDVAWLCYLFAVSGVEVGVQEALRVLRGGSDGHDRGTNTTPPPPQEQSMMEVQLQEKCLAFVVVSGRRRASASRLSTLSSSSSPSIHHFLTYGNVTNQLKQLSRQHTESVVELMRYEDEVLSFRAHCTQDLIPSVDRFCLKLWGDNKEDGGGAFERSTSKLVKNVTQLVDSSIQSIVHGAHAGSVQYWLKKVSLVRVVDEFLAIFPHRCKLLRLIPTAELFRAAPPPTSSSSSIRRKHSSSASSPTTASSSSSSRAPSQWYNTCAVMDRHNGGRLISLVTALMNIAETHLHKLGNVEELYANIAHLQQNIHQDLSPSSSMVFTAPPTEEVTTRSDEVQRKRIGLRGALMTFLSESEVTSLGKQQKRFELDEDDPMVANVIHFFSNLEIPVEDGTDSASSSTTNFVTMEMFAKVVAEYEVKVMNQCMHTWRNCVIKPVMCLNQHCLVQRRTALELASMTRATARTLAALEYSKMRNVLEQHHSKDVFRLKEMKCHMEDLEWVAAGLKTFTGAVHKLLLPPSTTTTPTTSDESINNNSASMRVMEEEAFDRGVGVIKVSKSTGKVEKKKKKYEGEQAAAAISSSPQQQQAQQQQLRLMPLITSVERQRLLGMLEKHLTRPTVAATTLSVVAICQGVVLDESLNPPKLDHMRGVEEEEEKKKQQQQCIAEQVLETLDEYPQMLSSAHRTSVAMLSNLLLPLSSSSSSSTHRQHITAARSSEAAAKASTEHPSSTSVRSVVADNGDSSAKPTAGNGGAAVVVSFELQLRKVWRTMRELNSAHQQLYELATDIEQECDRL